MLIEVADKHVEMLKKIDECLGGGKSLEALAEIAIERMYVEFDIRINSAIMQKEYIIGIKKQLILMNKENKNG